MRHIAIVIRNYKGSYMLIKQNLISRTVGKAPMSVEREEGYPLLGEFSQVLTIMNDMHSSWKITLI